MNKNFMRGWGAALLSVFLLAVAAFFFGFQMIAKEPAPRSVAVQALSAPAEKQGGYAVDESNFPDAVFRSWILDPANLGGAGSDGYLTAEELAEIREITLRGEAGAQIADLTGIGLFSLLQKLSVPYNALVSLDLRANTQLDYVNCSYNLLQELKVNGLDKLNAFYCEFNYLESLDLSGNPALEVLYCRHNLLTSLNLQNNTELVFIETFDNRLTEIDVSMLKKLEFLHIDHNRLTRLDMSGNPNLKGGGFVVRNNDIRELILPSIEGFTVYYDDFAEQDPIAGYERLEWYADASFTQPVTGDVEAKGQTLYGKRLPNRYTVSFSANGGTNAPAALSAEYGSEAALPLQEPARNGYHFLGWSKSAGGDEVFAAGASVLNLAGSRYDGEKVTLYALWEPITYVVRFDANAQDAAGEMSDLAVQYGNSVPLPANAFVRDEYEFMGWSLAADGDVILADRQSVLNLADTESAVVQLYAVWERTAEAVRRPFEQSLDAEVQALSGKEYFAEDWDRIVNISSSAKESFLAAGKDEEKMRSILAAATEQMRAVLTEEGRAQEIVSAWEGEYAEPLSGVFSPPVAYGSGEKTYALAEEALQRAARESLAEYSSLTLAESRLQAAEEAERLLAQKTDVLRAFLGCGKWLSRAERACAPALTEVRSAHFSLYEGLFGEYKNLSEEDRKFVSETALSEVFVRLRLAQEKGYAVATLCAHFERFSEEDYSEERWQELTEICRRYTELAESVGDSDSLLLYVGEGMENMDSVPDKTEETPVVPGPDEPGEGSGDTENPGDAEGPGADPGDAEEPGDTEDSGDTGGLPGWAKGLLIAGGCVLAALIAAAVVLFVRKKR